MHPGIHSKVKFSLNKTKVQPGMIVEFMYQSSYNRTGKRPTGPRNVKRLLWVLDPYFGRQQGGGDDVDSRGFYMWGIDLEKISAPLFVQLGPKKYGIEYWGPKPGEPIAKGSSVKQTLKFPHIIPIIDVPGQNGQAKWAAIKGQKMLVENYRSYDIDRIKGCQVVQYNFTDSKFKVNLSGKSTTSMPKTGDVDIGKGASSKFTAGLQ